MDDALEAEALQVNGDELAVDHQLHDGAADRRCLLDAVPTESRGEDHVSVVRMRPHDGVLVERVVVVVAGPGTLQLQPVQATRLLVSFFFYSTSFPHSSYC